MRRFFFAAFAVAAVAVTSGCVVDHGRDGRAPVTNYYAPNWNSRPPAWVDRGHSDYPKPPRYGRGSDKVVCDRSDKECYKWSQRRYQPAYRATERFFGDRAEDRQRARWD